MNFGDSSRGRYIRALCFAAALVILAFAVGQMVLSLPSVTSIGSLMRMSSLPLAIFCILVLVVIQSRLTLFPIGGAFYWRSALAASIAGLIAACGVLMLAKIGMTYFVVLMVVTMGLSVSIFLSIVKNDNRGFFLFFFIIPFLDFLDYDIYWKILPLHWGVDIVSAVNPSEHYYIGLYTAFVLLFSLSLILKKWFAGERFTITSLDYFLIAYILWVGLSVIFSPEPVLSLALFLDIVAGASFYVLVRYYIHTTGDFERFGWVMIAYAWLAMFLSLYFPAQRMGYEAATLIAERWSPRNWSPVIVAAVVMLPLTISLLQIQKRKVWRILLLIVFASYVLFVAITSQTRNMLASLVLSLPTALMYRRNRRVLFTFIFMIGVIAFFFFGNLITARFESWYSWDAFLVDQRMRLDGIRTAISIMQDHPVFGAGPGRWLSAVTSYGLERLRGQLLGSAHNLLLSTGSASGIPAMLFLLLISVVALKKLARASIAWLGNQQVLAVGLLWGLVGLLIAMNTGGGELSDHHSYSIVFFSWVGLSTVQGWNNQG